MYVCIYIYIITAVYSRISWVRNIWWSSKSRSDRSATATIVALHFRGSLWTIGLTLCLCNNYSILNHTKSLIGYPKIHWFIILFPIQMPFSEVYRKAHLQTDIKNHQKSQDIPSFLTHLDLHPRVPFSCCTLRQGFKQSWWSQRTPFRQCI